MPHPDPTTEQILQALERLNKLSQTGDAHAVAMGAPMEAAKIRGLAAILDSLTRQRATDATRESGTILGARIEASFSDLSKALDRFSTAANEGSARMVLWTKVLAFATLGLLFATLALVVITWLLR